MQYGVCLLSVIPARAQPSNKSEMVTQLLFGDLFKVIATVNDDWLQIEIAHDTYNCFIDKKQVAAITEQEYNALQQNNTPQTTELISVIQNKNTGSLFPIMLGSKLHNLNGNSISIANQAFTFEGNVNSLTDINNISSLVNVSLSLLEAPYLWGGKSAFGIDCSGFVQLIYGIIGKHLPRDAYQQAELGIPLAFIEESQPGDLAFFDNEEGHIIHVGMLLDDAQIIHASGKVRIDKIDHQGIFNVDLKRYTHQLRVLKRIL
jgi:cell wall-associated NlpC family hydrolase